MSLTSCSLRLSSRLPANCFKINQPRSAPRHASYHHISSTLQRTRHIPSFGIIGTAAPSSRSYWWSSSTPNNTSATQPIPPSPAVVEPIAAQPVPPTAADPPATSAVAEPSQLPAVDPVDPSIGFDHFSTLPPPLEYGDLASLGLTSYWPPGLVNWSLEITHFATGLPWLYTIVVGTIVWRAGLGYLQVLALQDAARMRAHAPSIDKAKQDLDYVKNDKRASAAEVQIATQKLQKVYESNGISITRPALLPFAQLPLIVGMFIGVKNLCLAPILELQHTGSWLIPDLTAISGTVNWDPYYCLPAMMGGAIIYQMRLTQRDQIAEGATAKHITNLLQLFTPVMIYLFSGLPAGLIVSALTGVGYSVVQSQILRLPNIRKKMGFPYLEKQDPPKLGESVLWAREKFRELKKHVQEQSKEDQAAQKRARILREEAKELEARRAETMKRQPRLLAAKDWILVPNSTPAAQRRTAKARR